MNSFFVTGYVASQGGRDYNEDSLLYAQAGNTGCWVVADGLGGHGGGDTASRVACQAVIDSFRANPAVTPEACLAHIQAADQAVRREQIAQPGLVRMRTTIVVLICDASQAVWGHAGDSRLYHFRGGAILYQTKDHSLPQHLVEAGEIAAAQIRRHEDRSRLLRVLGEEGAFQPTVLAEPVPIGAGDAFLLCTDGFWENVYELEMELDFAKSGKPADWLKFMEIRLQERVSGSHDNYSAIGIIGDNLPSPRLATPSAEVRKNGAPAPAKARPNPLLTGSVLALIPVILVLLGLTFVPADWLHHTQKKQSRPATPASTGAPKTPKK